MEERLTKLESKLAFQEQTIETLNEVVIEQQEQIKKLEQEMKRLREETEAFLDSGNTLPLQERPPHY